MKIQIIDSTVTQGRPVDVGEVLDVPDQEAQILIHCARATVFVDAHSYVAPTVEPEET